eukprot:1153495-Prymnesium_polylepis.1
MQLLAARASTLQVQPHLRSAPLRWKEVSGDRKHQPVGRCPRQTHHGNDMRSTPRTAPPAPRPSPAQYLVPRLQRRVGVRVGLLQQRARRRVLDAVAAHRLAAALRECARGAQLPHERGRAVRAARLRERARQPPAVIIARPRASVGEEEPDAARGGQQHPHGRVGEKGAVRDVDGGEGARTAGGGEQHRGDGLGGGGGADAQSEL